MYNTPILLIIFNRPETTQKVFEKIKLIKPQRLYIVSDGPRSEKKDDADQIKKAREITERVDWDCKAFRKYADNNLGCGKNVSEGISWFFENEEMGIILEDDVIPSISFFGFAEALLQKYKTDTRVMHISAVRYNEEKNVDEQSYFFSRYAHIQGWATWRRAWSQFDINMRDWPECKKESVFKNIFPNTGERNYWRQKFDRAYNLENKHFWGYQWQYAVNKNNGYCIVPIKNLAQNIGVDGEHNTEVASHHFREIDENFQLSEHPKFMIINKSFDDYHFEKHINQKRPFLTRVLRKLIRLVKSN